MEDSDREARDTEDFKSIPPDSREYYQDSPERPARSSEGETSAGRHEGAGTTDFVTSNYSEDIGRSPSETDIVDVSQEGS